MVAFLLLLAGSSVPAPAQEVTEPASGVFLVADRGMQDPRFREAVILLLSADRSGAMGLVINKPSDARISDIVSGMRKADRRKNRVYFGGPVGAGQLLMLLRTKDAVRDAVRILNEISVTTDRDVLLSTIRKQRAGDDYRLFAGYAGWAAGQLEWELNRGQWRLVAASAEMVFHEKEDMVWPAMIRKSEELIVQKAGPFPELARITSLHPFQAAFFSW